MTTFIIPGRRESLSSELNIDRTDLEISDPLGQTHNPDSSDR